jgi:hypothetical protein
MRKLLAHIILLANTKEISISDWIRYAWNAIIHFAPVAFVLSAFNAWFTDNRQFAIFILTAAIINAIVGARRHWVHGTFSPKLCFWKNIEMFAVVMSVYWMLEMLRYTVGSNFAGDAFRIFIQVTALLYPISKTFKNIFILTKGKYPPEFIMTKLYNFEKNGDLKNLFTTDKTEKDETK